MRVHTINYFFTWNSLSTNLRYSVETSIDFPSAHASNHFLASKQLNPNVSTDLTTRMKYIITSINGDRDQKNIRDFIDTYLLAPDARALRQYYNQISPDIDMKYKPNDENYVGEGIDIPIGLNFFWPDSGV